MTATQYHEPARDVPVLGEYDVIVCGGGPAGCAAAIASARLKARTLLIEREGTLGGATVTQAITPILSTNGVDFQGLWHTLATTLQRLDGITNLSRDERFGTTWVVGSMNPEMVKLAWDELLAAAGVTVLHLALSAGAIVEDGQIRGVLIETKAGRSAVMAKRVIDCTGDGDVCAAAGTPWDQGAAGMPWAMGVSLQAWYGGVPTAPDYVPGTINRVGGTGRSLGNVPLFQAGLLRMLHVNPLDPWDLSRALQEGRRQVLQRYLQKKAIAGHERVFLAGIANQPGVRSSRRIRGLATATADDARNLRKHADGVARCSWEIDIHSPDTPVTESIKFDLPDYQARQRRTERGDYFDIPYGCLVPQGVENLLVAGRCISADHEAQASLRIQQTCLATGEAAGVAAALSLHHGVSPRQLDAAAVVAQLARDRAAAPPAFDCLRT